MCERTDIVEKLVQQWFHSDSVLDLMIHLLSLTDWYHIRTVLWQGKHEVNVIESECKECEKETKIKCQINETTKLTSWHSKKCKSKSEKWCEQARQSRSN